MGRFKTSGCAFIPVVESFCLTLTGLYFSISARDEVFAGRLDRE